MSGGSMSPSPPDRLTTARSVLRLTVSWWRRVWEVRVTWISSLILYRTTITSSTTGMIKVSPSCRDCGIRSTTRSTGTCRTSTWLLVSSASTAFLFVSVFTEIYTEPTSRRSVVTCRVSACSFSVGSSTIVRIVFSTSPLQRVSRGMVAVKFRDDTAGSCHDVRMTQRKNYSRSRSSGTSGRSASGML